MVYQIRVYYLYFGTGQGVSKNSKKHKFYLLWQFQSSSTDKHASAWTAHAMVHKVPNVPTEHLIRDLSTSGPVQLFFGTTFEICQITKVFVQFNGFHLQLSLIR